ncbi:MULTISPECIES: hypothetical protein [Orbaceae]|uniref:Flagellar FliJ protein n=1 Tax=Frischella japonica TaxID=2741544 RepID=A0ABR7QWZ3_9GAMM|nr:hypothetical protein [Frischella japonica]MBC9130748.1 hypothetical protein [Frischella japonica]
MAINKYYKMEIAKQIIDSSQYKNLVDNIKKSTRLKVLSEYRDAVASRDEQKMKLANLSKEEAMKLLEMDKDFFNKFVLYKMQKLMKNIQMEKSLNKKMIMKQYLVTQKIFYSFI